MKIPVASGGLNGAASLCAMLWMQQGKAYAESVQGKEKLERPYFVFTAQAGLKVYVQRERGSL